MKFQQSIPHSLCILLALLAGPAPHVLGQDADVRNHPPLSHGRTVSGASQLTEEASGIRDINPAEAVAGTGADAFATLDFFVSNVCQFYHSTLVGSPGIPASPTSPYVRAVWDMGDGSPLYDMRMPANDPRVDYRWMNILHRYQTSRFFDITLTLYDVNNNALATKTKSVFASPTPGKPAAVDTIDVCLGSQLVFAPGAVVADPGASLIWYTRNATNTGWDRSLTPPSPVMNTLGIFKYGIAQDLNGCESINSAEVNVVVSTLPAPPNVGPTFIFCQDESPRALSIPGAPTNNLWRAEPVWYDSPTGPQLAGAPIPKTDASAVGNRSFWVSLRSTKGCGESIRKETIVTVNPSPAAPSIATKDICVGIAGSLVPNATVASGHTLRWWGTSAVGGSMTNSPPTLPTPLASDAGVTTTYYVSQFNNTTGCMSPRVGIPVTVRPNPTATTSARMTVCEGVSPAVTFNATGGTPNYAFTYTVDGGAPQTSSSAGSIQVTIPTGSSVVKEVRLQRVTDNYGCIWDNGALTQVNFLAKPRGTLSGSNEACAFAVSPISFTGSNGTPSYTFNYELNGVPQAPLSSGSSSSIATLDPSSTAPIGLHTYTLRRVSYTVDGTTCESDNLAQNHSFNVLPSPTVSVTIQGQASNSIVLCQNYASPTIAYSITDGQAPYTLTYNYNSVRAVSPPLSTPPTGSATLAFPIATAASGTHEFELLEVRDSKGCIRRYAGNTATMATVKILRAPDATITGSVKICNRTGGTPVEFIGSGGTAPYTFDYSLVSPTGTTTGSKTSGTSDRATLTAPLDVDGDFEYRLQRVSYQDGGTTCSKTFSGVSATVTVHPIPATPVAAPAEFCQFTTATTPSIASVAGTELRWYGNAASGGTPSSNQAIQTTTPGLSSYYVSRYHLTTGCESPRMEHVVRIHPQPRAVITQGVVVCQASPEPLVSLTGDIGTAPYTFAYEVQDGGSATPGSQTSNGGASVAIPVPTATPGTRTYRLLKVTDAKGCEYAPSPALSAVYRVLATPDAQISAPLEICNADVSSVTFSGGTGKAPYTFSYRLNSGAVQDVLSDATGTAKVPIPSGATGQQVFTLTRVSYADGTTCHRDLASNATTTVNPLPTATASIAGLATNSLLLCQNAPATSITLTGAGGTSPYSMSYLLNGVPQAPVSAGPSYNIPVSTSAKANLVYELSRVTDAKGCSRSVTQTATVRILTNPVATLKGAVKVCEKDAEPVLTFKGNQGSAPYRFTYTLNGGPDLVVLSPAGADSATLSASTSVPGTFTYRLKEVSYTDGITCVSSLSEEAMVTVYDLPIGSMKGSSSDIEICQLQPFPEILFSGRGGTPPYTFRYRRNNDVLSSTGNPFIEKASTRTAGTTLYELLEIQDARLCRQAQAGKVKVTVHPTPVVDAGPDKIMLENIGITLDGSASNGNALRFQWTPSTFLSDPMVPRPLATPPQDTRYLLTAISDMGCSDTSSMLLKVLLKPVIPNTFTPNGDGYNDRWEILNLSAYPDAIVEIYDDRGHLLMRSTGQYRPWDGTYKGMPLPVGTYYYVIHPRSGRDKVAGYITILR